MTVTDPHTVLDCAGVIITDYVPTAIHWPAGHFGILNTRQRVSNRDARTRIWPKACVGCITSGVGCMAIRHISGHSRNINHVPFAAAKRSRLLLAIAGGTINARQSMAIRSCRSGPNSVVDRCQIRDTESFTVRVIQMPTATDGYQNTAGSWRNALTGRCSMMRMSITSTGTALIIDRRTWSYGRARNHAASVSWISSHGHGRFSNGMRAR